MGGPLHPQRRALPLLELDHQGVAGSSQQHQVRLRTLPLRGLLPLHSKDELGPAFKLGHPATASGRERVRNQAALATTPGAQLAGQESQPVLGQLHVGLGGRKPGAAQLLRNEERGRAARPLHPGQQRSARRPHPAHEVRSLRPDHRQDDGDEGRAPHSPPRHLPSQQEEAAQFAALRQELLRLRRVHLAQQPGLQPPVRRGFGLGLLRLPPEPAGVQRGDEGQRRLLQGAECPRLHEQTAHPRHPQLKLRPQPAQEAGEAGRGVQHPRRAVRSQPQHLLPRPLLLPLLLQLRLLQVLKVLPDLDLQGKPHALRGPRPEPHHHGEELQGQAVHD
mmetsp:Transcript_18098/g.30900  ORF Transcript_18098/g.30900 Transcript_18098/m.30900 type:complete len:334 (+) Transcript_18098:841-1842(+)